MRTATAAKAGMACAVAGGLLLACCCMLFICPLMGAAAPALESCHSVPSDRQEPSQCPYALMDLVYSVPQLDAAAAGGDVGLGGPLWAEDSGRAGLRAVPVGRADASAPPGPPLRILLQVFRI